MNSTLIRMTLAVSLLAGAAPQAEPAPANEGPRIAPDSLEHDFGEVDGTRALEHVFRVENRGDKPLVITRVHSSCGCTAAMMETSVIDPGGEGKLRVSFNPGSREGTARKTVSIYSNDPVRSVLEIAVRARVVPPSGETERRTRKRTHPRRYKLFFEGSCADCHAPKKKDAIGAELYASVCAPCHGEEGEGRKVEDGDVAPPLDLRLMTVKTEAGIRQVISSGTGHPAMPGFDREYEGPLSPGQVASLVAIIRDGFKEIKASAKEREEAEKAR